MTRELTEIQRSILDFLATRHAQTGIYPTVREIAREMGLRSTNTVVYHLRELQRKGYLVRSREARCYWLTKDVGAVALSPAHVSASSALRRAPSGATRIPILGRVAAGEPILAEQNFDGLLDLQSYFDPAGDTFALRVQGDSMIEAGIFDGDIVIVRGQPKLNNGEIGVAIIGEDATVKRIYDDGDAWRLVPANSAMEPLRVAKGSADFRIAGKVVGVVRKLR